MPPGRRFSCAPAAPGAPIWKTQTTSYVSTADKLVCFDYLKDAPDGGKAGWRLDDPRQAVAQPRFRCRMRPRQHARAGGCRRPQTATSGDCRAATKERSACRYAHKPSLLDGLPFHELEKRGTGEALPVAEHTMVQSSSGQAARAQQ